MRSSLESLFFVSYFSDISADSLHRVRDDCYKKFTFGHKSAFKRKLKSTKTQSSSLLMFWSLLEYYTLLKSKPIDSIDIHWWYLFNDYIHKSSLTERHCFNNWQLYSWEYCLAIIYKLRVYCLNGSVAIDHSFIVLILL
jgi:hypothetical protein